MRIPFNYPVFTGKELDYITQAVEHGHTSSNGPFTKKCQAWIEEQTGCRKAFLTHSCTGALEMSAILAGIAPGDEVIMPSYTFVSTANAFVLRSAIPVFVDIRPDTLNIDETKIEAAITEKTKAIVPVHYAGVGCEMEVIMDLANRYGLSVIEDAAQGVSASYKGQPLGAIGHLGALSFHETKNIISGEGGALLVNDPQLIERATYVSEKGTNRTRFFRGEVDKYTWVDVGSSYQPSELIAAFLWAQLEEAQAINHKRSRLWQRYHAALADLEARGSLRRPLHPPHCRPNAHMYYILVEDHTWQQTVLQCLKQQGIGGVFHYIPLHSAVAGKKYGRPGGDLSITEDLSGRLIRLPLWPGLSEQHVDEVCTNIHAVFS